MLVTLKPLTTPLQRRAWRPRRHVRAIAGALTLCVAFLPLTPGSVAPVAAQSIFSGSVRTPPPADLPSTELPPSTLTLPDLGDSARSALSPADERKIGEEVIHQARLSGSIMDDPEVTDYLNDLGQRLVAAVPGADMDFHFFAVNDPQINAFALPGGYVGVYTGLILLAQTESELASVLAHEISHVTQHHIARMIADQKNTMLMSLGTLALALLAAKAGGGSGGQAAQAAVMSAQALSIQQQLNFTRANEYEADRIGFQRLAAGGFDVNAMGTFMKRMQDATRFSDSNTPNYLRTHPVTLERIAEAQARAQAYPYRQVPDSLDFQMVRALLKSYQGEPQDAVAYFDNALANHQYNSLVATRYGLVASLLRAKDYTRAKAMIAVLDRTAPRHPMIDAIAGHVLMESGDLDGAIKRFKNGLALFPNKKQLIYDYPDALLRAGRAREASEFVESELPLFVGDGPLNKIAARAYAAQGMESKQHQYLAEFYVWQGSLREAITQLELASKAKDTDFYSASVIDTRLKGLRKEYADQQKDASRIAG